MDGPRHAYPRKLAICSTFSCDARRFHSAVLGYAPSIRKQNRIIQLEGQIYETLSALERIAVRFAVFALFIAGLYWVLARW